MANVIQGPRGAAASQMLWIDNGDGSFSPQIKLASGSFTIGSVDDGGGSLTVDDGGLSLTVDDGNTTISVDDGGSTVSIDDGGGSITVDGTVALSSVPASSRTTDSMSLALATDALMNNLTALTPKFQKITASSSGVTNIVAAVTSKKIRVLSWSLVCNAAVNVKWQSHVTPTDITGLHYFGANGGISVPFSPLGHFETVAGEALDINLSGAVAVGGVLAYVEV